MFTLTSLKASRGFTIVEALISVLIMVVVTLALLGMVPYGYGQVQQNATQVQAIALGQQYLDALRNAKQTNSTLPAATTAPVDQGNTFMTGSLNATSSVFTIAPNACPTATAGPVASQYDCSVTVTWTENGRSDTIKVESYVTQ
jgi:Tfp pilus assembly protein PilV